MREINATADIITSSYARIDLDEILGVGAFELSRTLVGQPDWLDEPAHLHDPTLSSVSIELDGDLRPEALESWLGDYVAAHGDDIYRLKGVLAVKADYRRFVAQGVHKIFEVRASAPWGADHRTNRFVVIGRDLDRADLLAGLQSCLA
jgi:G3E family GTPase